MAEAKVYSIEKKLEADNIAELMKRQAETRLEAARLITSALIAEAEAEEG